VHAHISGVVDHLADDDTHALQIVRGIVAMLPHPDPPPWTVEALIEPVVDPTELSGVMSADTRTPMTSERSSLAWSMAAAAGLWEWY
jgi:3-methylcrotonyl-CoA carboxylase beta subunit